MTKSSAFLEYMKLHKISLEQDKFKVFDQMLECEDEDLNKFRDLDYEYNNLVGQIEATRHLLSVATDIMESTNERYNNDNI
jgi:succinate dehydrogenase flavin-adding protein (antitoxin of CptAB toxin-antitoxin module)